MKKRCLWAALFWGLPFFLLAQKEDYNWVIARNSIIHFTDSIPWVEKLPNGSYDFTSETNVSISDSNGQLLLYGFPFNSFIKEWDTISPIRSSIKNAKHEIIKNGTEIYFSESVTNGALFLNQDKNIYLFCLNVFLKKKATYTRSDFLTILTKNKIIKKDTIEVAAKNEKVSALSLAEKLTAIRHANGKDWWVITHDFYKNIFHIFLFRDGSIIDSISEPAGQAFIEGDTISPFLGEITVSPDGSILLLANNGGKIGEIIYDTELFHFDRCCGKITFYKSIKKKSYYGAAFSPSGHYIYLSNLYGNTYQYEVNASDIEASEIQVSPVPPYNKEWGWGGGQLELGPDGKIYSASQNSFYIGAILYPDKKGKKCVYKPDFLHLKGNISEFGLPSFPNYRLGAMESAYYHHDTTICPNKKTVIGLPPDCDYNYEWSPSTGLSDTTVAMPTVSINKNTTYVRRTYSARFGCTSRYDTFTVRVLDKTDTSCFVSRAEPEPKYLLEMYPNPVRDNVTLNYNLPEGIQCEVELFTVSRSRVMKFDLKGHKGTEEIKLTGLVDGMYLAQFRLSNGELITQKLIIAH